MFASGLVRLGIQPVFGAQGRLLLLKPSASRCAELGLTTFYELLFCASRYSCDISNIDGTKCRVWIRKSRMMSPPTASSAASWQVRARVAARSPQKIGRCQTRGDLHPDCWQVRAPGRCHRGHPPRLPNKSHGQGWDLSSWAACDGLADFGREEK